MKKSLAKYAAFSIVLSFFVYCCSIFVMRGSIYLPFLFRPWAYLSVAQVHTAQFIAILAGLLFPFSTWVVHSAKKKAFDPILGLLSFLFPLVGIVLGIVYRVRAQKDTAASNMYLLLSIVSTFLFVILGIFILL